MIVEKEKIIKVIEESDNIVFFGGAGVSTESGIPDFRSVDGLYNQQYDYPPERILSHSFFYENQKVFYKFYKEKCLKPMINSKPNDTHKALAKLESLGKLKAIVTQNIDNLHEMAGSKIIYKLHGTSYKNHCIKCKKAYSIEDILNDKRDVFTCECGGLVRPDIVLYEEGLDNEVVNKSIKAIANADLLIVAGTSLVVYPAAGFINYYRGNKLVLINKDPIANEENIDYVCHNKLGEIFSIILKDLENK